MGRTAIAWGSAAAHNLAAYSQSELGFATHFNMYPEVQLPSPNGSLGHTRGLVNCAVARSKALINAVMPVYFVWNKKSHISNGTAKSVGSHSVSNTRSSGISVEDCDQSEILVSAFESLSGPGRLPRSVDVSNALTSILVHEIQPIKITLSTSKRSIFSWVLSQLIK
jgi:hypothetical protein